MYAYAFPFSYISTLLTLHCAAARRTRHPANVYPGCDGFAGNVNVPSYVH